MRYRLTIDFEPGEGPAPTLWDITHNAPVFVAIALSDLKPADVTRFYLRKLDGRSIEAALEACEEIDIREFWPS